MSSRLFAVDVAFSLAAGVSLDIVVGVAIVLDQCAAFIITRELDRVWVDGCHRSEEGISSVDNDRLVLVVSSSGKLRVGAWFDVSVASDHRELNIMCVVVAVLVIEWRALSRLHSIVVRGSKMVILGKGSIEVDVLGRSART